MLERSQVPIEQELKIETGERRSLCHKYVSLAGLNYKTSFYASNGCQPSRVFHGRRIPYNVLDLKLGIHPKQIPIPTLQIAQDVLDQTEMIYQGAHKKAMKAYNKHKVYYDKKANASKLKRQNMCMSYNRKQSIKSKVLFTEFRRIGPFNFEKLLPNNNYLVRKIGTNKTKVLDCMRLHQFTPDNPYPKWKSRLDSGNLIWKWALNTMICRLKHGKVTKTGQVSRQCTIIHTTTWTCSTIWFTSGGNLEHTLKCTIPRDCSRRSCGLFPSWWRQSGARHRQCFQRLQPAKAMKGPQTQQHVSRHIWMPSSPYAQRLSI